MYGRPKQLHPHCMNMLTQLNTELAQTESLITGRAQQLLDLQPFLDPSLALADSLGSYVHNENNADFCIQNFLIYHLNKKPMREKAVLSRGIQEVC